MMLNVLGNYPSRGYGNRISIYFQEMFPIIPRFVTALILYISFTLYLSRISQVTFDALTLYTIMGAWDLFALTLILRLMNELKDREADLELFSSRPLPSERVKEADIKFSLLIICTLFVIPHFAEKRILLSSFIVLGYTFLMFKYLFLSKRWHGNLLINLATHNPVITLFLLHITVLFTVQFDIQLIPRRIKIVVP
jgi:4-hydroxybenzoate polyprenyltransferase